MSLAGMVRRMAEAGAPPEAIAIALEEIEALQVALEARRTADRDRKRAQRDRQNSANVTGHSEDIPRTVTDKTSPLSPPPKVSPDPFKEPPPISPQPISGRARAKFDAPDGVTSDQWKAFRQQRKKPLNERSYALLCNKLNELAEAGWPPGDMIDRAIERGWETVFEPKDGSNGQGNRGGNGYGPKADPTLALVRSAMQAQRQDGRDHRETGLALPPGQYG